MNDDNLLISSKFEEGKNEVLDLNEFRSTENHRVTENYR